MFAMNERVTPLSSVDRTFIVLTPFDFVRDGAFLEGVGNGLFVGVIDRINIFSMPKNVGIGYFKIHLFKRVECARFRVDTAFYLVIPLIEFRVYPYDLTPFQYPREIGQR